LWSVNNFPLELDETIPTAKAISLKDGDKREAAGEARGD
jgi:hypothetical protein